MRRIESSLDGSVTSSLVAETSNQSWPASRSKYASEMILFNDATETKEDLQSQAGQQANKLRSASRDAAAAWEWIQENRDKFEGDVYGPPIIECTLKDQRHASAIESVIGDGEKLAFTVTSQNDFKMLNRQLYDLMRLSQVNIRNSMHTLASFRAPTCDRGFGTVWSGMLDSGPH